MQVKAHHHPKDACYRWGMKGHLFQTCHTSKHLIDLYQASKENEKNVEMNFINLDGKNEITNLDISDFFVDSSENSTS